MRGLTSGSSYKQGSLAQGHVRYLLASPKS